MTDNSRCEFRLDLADAERATMRWFDIWAASIAANAGKCYSNLTLPRNAFAKNRHILTPELHRRVNIPLKPMRIVLLTSRCLVCVRQGRSGAALVGELTYPVVTFFLLERLSVRR